MDIRHVFRAGSCAQARRLGAENLRFSSSLGFSPIEFILPFPLGSGNELTDANQYDAPPNRRTLGASSCFASVWRSPHVQKGKPFLTSQKVLLFADPWDPLLGISYYDFLHPWDSPIKFILLLFISTTFDCFLYRGCYRFSRNSYQLHAVFCAVAAHKQG